MTWVPGRLVEPEALPHHRLTPHTLPLWATYFPSGAIPVNGVKDINGQARAEGVIDLGADEYGTAP